MSELSQAERCRSHFATLDLAETATREEVKQAWRDLVKVWHPDRFASDPRLAERCHLQLKKINKAYEELDMVFEQGFHPATAFDRPRAAPEIWEHCRRCGKQIKENAALCDACVDELEAIYQKENSRPAGRVQHGIPLFAYLVPAGVVSLALVYVAYVDLQIAFWAVLGLMIIATIFVASRFTRSDRQ